MSVTYLFLAEFTKTKVATSPANAPTIDIVDAANPTGALLVDDGSPTVMTNMAGIYVYAYSTNTLTYRPVGLFHTADTTVDLQDIPSYPQILLDANNNVLSSPQTVVLLSAGSGAGQLDFTSGVVKANLAQILGTALTETVGGYLAAGFKKLHDVTAPVFTLASINQTGDVFAKFTGITLLANWLRGLARKDAMDSTAKTELNTGGGIYNEATDSLEAQLDSRPAAAPTMITGQEVRDAMKLAPTAGAPAGGSVDDHLDLAATQAKMLEYAKALARSDAPAASSDIAGTYDNTTDSQQAIRDTAPMGSAMRGTDNAMLATAKPIVGGYDTGQDPATLLLVTPANKITTDAANAVKIQKMAVTVAAADVSGNLPADVKAYTVQPTVDVDEGAIATAVAAALDVPTKEEVSTQVASDLATAHGAGVWGPGSGAGDKTLTYTVTSSVDATPIEGVVVELYNNIGMTATPTQTQTTNVFGVATFTNLIAGTYYLKRIKSGWSFTNPDTEVVS
jgi:hypothetical protein